MGGNVTAKTGTVDSLYGYAGQYGYVYDQETGLYFLESRYYDPQVGRFTTKDRFNRFNGFEDRPASQNQYTYCENNPINSVDPDGHSQAYAEVGSSSKVKNTLNIKVSIMI